jgi:hypothetical protein
MNTENPKIVHNLTALSALGLARCCGLSVSKGLTLVLLNLIQSLNI